MGGKRARIERARSLGLLLAALGVLVVYGLGAALVVGAPTRAAVASARAVAGWLDTHPPLEERVRRAREMGYAG